MTGMWKGESRRRGGQHGQDTFAFKTKRLGLCHPRCAVTADGWGLGVVPPLPPARPGLWAYWECRVSVAGSYFHLTGRPFAEPVL